MVRGGMLAIKNAMWGQHKKLHINEKHIIPLGMHGDGSILEDAFLQQALEGR